MNLFKKLLSFPFVSLLLAYELFSLLRFMTMAISIISKTWTRGIDMPLQKSLVHVMLSH